jgi:hypothetical protein
MHIVINKWSAVSTSNCLGEDQLWTGRTRTHARSNLYIGWEELVLSTYPPGHVHERVVVDANDVPGTP